MTISYFIYLDTYFIYLDMYILYICITKLETGRGWRHRKYMDIEIYKLGVYLFLDIGNIISNIWMKSLLRAIEPKTLVFLVNKSKYNL